MVRVKLRVKVRVRVRVSSPQAGGERVAKRRVGVARAHGGYRGGEVGEGLDGLCGERAATRERRRDVCRMRLQRGAQPVGTRQLVLADALEQPGREPRVVRVGGLGLGLGVGVQQLARHHIVRLEPPPRRHQLGRALLEQAERRLQLRRYLGCRRGTPVGATVRGAPVAGTRSQYVQHTWGPEDKPPCASGTYTTREADTRRLYVPYGARGVRVSSGRHEAGRVREFSDARRQHHAHQGAQLNGQVVDARERQPERLCRLLTRSLA